MNAKTADDGTLDLSPGPLNKIGPYKIIREVGRGTMGTVYHAEHDSLKRKVAVKVLPSNLAMVEGRLDRFKCEMEAIGRLDHRNIVRATDAGQADGVFFLAMEYVDGRDVESLLQEKHQLDVATACEIARQTALGLQHISENGLVHRDLKPSNLMLGSDGTVKVLDLGIAMLRESGGQGGLTQANTLMGTPDFMAPEQIDECRSVDIRADIYSLGCTLYMLLAGQPPFADAANHVAKLMAHRNDEPLPIGDLVPDLPASLASIIHKMMAKQPQDRYQEPIRVAEALAEFSNNSTICELAGSGPSKWNPSPANETSSQADTSKKSALPWVAIATLVGLFAGVVFILSNKADQAVDTLSRDIAPAAATAGEINDTTHAISKDTESLTTVAKSIDERSQQLVDSSRSIDRKLGSISKSTAAASATASSIEANTQRVADQNSAIVTTAKSLDSSAQKLAASSTAIDENTKSISDNTERIADSLDAFRKAFESAQANPGLLEKPETPGDFYHNARIAEEKGDYRVARRNYLEFFRFGLDVVDPHYRFQQFLKLQEGLAGAREIYASVPGDKTTVVRRYASALVQEPETRSDQLRQLIDEEPEFAPAYYELSRAVSKARLGKQSFSDVKDERELLSQFLKLHESGHLVRYFLDKSEVATMISDAKQRLAASETQAELEAVKFVWTYNDPNWTVTLQFPEQVVEVFLRSNSDAEFKSLGMSSHVNPLTGKPMANQWTVLPIREPATIEVKYTDVNGKEQGPFEYGFDPAVDKITAARTMLNMMPQQNWAAFGTNHNSHLFYFSSLYAVSYGVKEIRYGFDQDEPNLVHQLVDLSQDNAVPYVSIPAGAKFAVVQVVLKDGTKTDVVRIPR